MALTLPPRSFQMKGFEIDHTISQFVRQDDREAFMHDLVKRYLVQINHAWYRVELIVQNTHGARTLALDDGSTDRFVAGNQYHFVLTACDSPDQRLPDIIKQFVERHITTGETALTFVNGKWL